MRILWSGLKLWRLGGYQKFKLHNVDVPDVQSYFYDMDIFPLAFVGVTVQGDRLVYWLLDSGKLGHKNIKNTLIYTHRVNFEREEPRDDWIDVLMWNGLRGGIFGHVHCRFSESRKQTEWISCSDEEEID